MSLSTHGAFDARHELALSDPFILHIFKSRCFHCRAEKSARSRKVCVSLCSESKRKPDREENILFVRTLLELAAFELISKQFQWTEIRCEFKCRGDTANCLGCADGSRHR